MYHTPYPCLLCVFHSNEQILCSIFAFTTTANHKRPPTIPPAPPLSPSINLCELNPSLGAHNLSTGNETRCGLSASTTQAVLSGWCGRAKAQSSSVRSGARTCHDRESEGLRKTSKNETRSSASEKYTRTPVGAVASPARTVWFLESRRAAGG